LLSGGSGRLGLDRQPRIAANVVELAGAGHHPKHQLAVDELDLDAADAGGTVFSQGGQRLVPPGIENPPHARGQFRLGAFDITLAGHGYEGSGVGSAGLEPSTSSLDRCHHQ
jgi:hypothetical protein